MKILHCIASFSGGGAEHQLVYLINQQLQANFEDQVGVAYLHKGPAHCLLRSHEQLREHHLANYGHYDVRLSGMLAGLLLREGYELLQTWLPLMDVHGGVAALLTRKPWILCERNSKPPRGWKGIIREYLARKATRIVANSNAGAGYWLSREVSKEKVTVIRNGLPDLKPDERDGRLPMTDIQHPVIVYGGSFTKQKQVKLVAKVLSRSCERTDGTALMFGTGPQLPEVRRILRSEVGGRRVHLMGYRKNFRQHLGACDLLISLSSFEGMPNVVMESTAAGLKMVLSDIPAHRELLHEGLVDFVGPQWRVERIVEVVVNALSRGEENGVIRKRQQIASSWSIESAARQYRSLYAEGVDE